MILVTGAGGKTGRSVIAALADRGAAVRAFVRRPEPIPGAAELHVGDMTVVDDWRRALRGVDAVYHICPNMHPREVPMARLALAAAEALGVEHFAYHSVLHPQIEAMPHHWRKMRVEQLLFTADLSWTILQPTAYMQNLRVQWSRVVEEGVLELPYPPDTRLALVDLAEVAEVAARVLTEPGHTGAVYELVGMAGPTQREVAEILSEAAGRSVQAREIPLDRWAAQATGLSDEVRDTLLAMFRYYAEHGMTGNANVLGWLLGRAPTGLAEVAQRWLK